MRLLDCLMYMSKSDECKGGLVRPSNLTITDIHRTTLHAHHGYEDASEELFQTCRECTNADDGVSSKTGWTSPRRLRVLSLAQLQTNPSMYESIGGTASTGTLWCFRHRRQGTSRLGAQPPNSFAILGQEMFWLKALGSIFLWIWDSVSQLIVERIHYFRFFRCALSWRRASLPSSLVPQ